VRSSVSGHGDPLHSLLRGSSELGCAAGVLVEVQRLDALAVEEAEHHRVRDLDSVVEPRGERLVALHLVELSTLEEGVEGAEQDAERVGVRDEVHGCSPWVDMLMCVRFSEQGYRVPALSYLVKAPLAAVPVVLVSATRSYSAFFEQLDEFFVSAFLLQPLSAFLDRRLIISGFSNLEIALPVDLKVFLRIVLKGESEHGELLGVIQVRLETNHEVFDSLQSVAFQSVGFITL